LAPFNTTNSKIADVIPQEVSELIQSKSCLKFNGRAKEIDRQYEINNNAELDNGLLHE
jgi:hypothetical protein